MKRTIALVDTMFSRINMGDIAIQTVQTYSKEYGWDVEIIRKTVPGFKDLAVECLILFGEFDADICVAMGWVGGMPIDSQCAHEASLALGTAQLMAKKHILEVFIHERESADSRELLTIATNRTVEHVKNALDLLFAPERLTQKAGQGVRQGGPSVGSLADQAP